MILLKVTIKVDQGASTFWMCGPLRVKIPSLTFPYDGHIPCVLLNKVKNLVVTRDYHYYTYKGH